MANTYKDNLALFHAFNSLYSVDKLQLSQAVSKSGHSIASSDVKVDNIPFAPTFEKAIARTKGTWVTDGSKIYKLNSEFTYNKVEDLDKLIGLTVDTTAKTYSAGSYLKNNTTGNIYYLFDDFVFDGKNYPTIDQAADIIPYELKVGKTYELDELKVSYLEKVILTCTPDSNGESLYYAGKPDGTGTGYVDKWISPLDSLDGFKISVGYSMKLYTNSGVEIMDNGGWFCNYNNGVVVIDKGTKPSEITSLSMSLKLKASMFVYIGKTIENTDFAPSWGEM